MDSAAFATQLAEHLDKRCESAELDFKCQFDPASNRDWCELVKDIVAMANSGGGIIAIGLNDDGSRASSSIQSVFDLDPADVSNKIQKYTNSSYGDFRIIEMKFEGNSIACLAIGGVHTPLLFERPGTYPVEGTNQQKSAFSQGTVYFRHGAKSEPGTTDDMHAFVEREVENRRSVWLDNIRKVVEAPAGSRILVVPDGPSEITSEKIREVRITNRPEAPLVRELNPNNTHPYRQKEVAQRLTEKFGSAKIVSSSEVFAVRKAHAIDCRPEFCYRPTFSSPQFSEAFIDWFVSECSKNPEFIDSARQYVRTQNGEQKVPNFTDERLEWLDSFMRKHGYSQIAIARKFKVSASTISLLLRGIYGGDVEKLLQQIDNFRRTQS